MGANLPTPRLCSKLLCTASQPVQDFDLVRRLPYCLNQTSPSAADGRCYAEFAFIGNYKCGTTSFANVLFSHPFLQNFWQRFHPTQGSEDQFFNREPDQDDRVKYMKAMPPSSIWPEEGVPPVVGHYRPSLLQDSQVMPTRFMRFFPNWRTLKLLLMLRDPVSAKESGYWFNRRHERDKSIWSPDQFDGFVRDEVKRASTFGNCVATTDSNAAAKCGNPQLCHELSGFLYHYHLRQWIRQGFGMEQFKIFTLEQYIAQPEPTSKAVFSFLGVATPFAKHDNAGARRVNPTPDHPPMSSTSRTRLQSFFAPHVKLLKELFPGAELNFSHFPSSPTTARQQSLHARPHW